MPANEKHQMTWGERARRPEFVIGVLGIMLVAAFVGLLVFEAVAENEPLPRLQVSVRDVDDSAADYRVEVTVENSGDETAAGVLVTGTLTQNDKTIEEASATVSFVPAGSTRQAMLLFDRDPREYELDVRPLGFELP